MIADTSSSQHTFSCGLKSLRGSSSSVAAAACLPPFLPLPAFLPPPFMPAAACPAAVPAAPAARALSISSHLLLLASRFIVSHQMSRCNTALPVAVPCADAAAVRVRYTSCRVERLSIT